MAVAGEQAWAEVLAQSPALAAPPGDINNLVNPYSRRWLVIFTSATTLTVTTLFVAIRVYTKRFINKLGLRWDDYTSILAWLGYIGYTYVGIQAADHGGFTHQWNVSAVQTMRFLHYVNDLMIVYGPVMFLTKLSLLLQLLQIFASRRTGVTYYVCHFMIWFNLLFYGSFMFVAIFACSPRRRFWNPLVPGHCVDIDGINIATSVINSASDLVLLVLPIVCVFSLQMTLRKKIGVSAVFATAVFACVASIMRLVTSVQARGAKDVTWALLPEGLWGQGELSSGIICGCMPAIPQFFKHFVPFITSKLGSGESDKPSAGSPTKETGRTRKPIKIPRRFSDTYMELDDQQSLKVAKEKGAGLRASTDEIIADDEEKVISAITEDAISHDSRPGTPRTQGGVCGSLPSRKKKPQEY